MEKVIIVIKLVGRSIIKCLCEQGNPFLGPRVSIGSFILRFKMALDHYTIECYLPLRPVGHSESNTSIFSKLYIFSAHFY